VRSREGIASSFGDIGGSRVDRHEGTRIELPLLSLPKGEQALFINEFALYLSELGRIADAEKCYEACRDIAVKRKDWKTVSAVGQNICEVQLHSGRLTDGLANAGTALEFAKRGKDASERWDSYAFRAHARALKGSCKESLSDYHECQRHVRRTYGDTPLFSSDGIRYALLLTWFGRHGEAREVTESNIESQSEDFGSPDTEPDIPKCKLILAELCLTASDLSNAAALCDWAREWGVVRDGKEVHCWSSLTRAILTLAAVDDQQTEEHDPLWERLDSVRAAIAEGRKIARDCGFGLYHIDLLLTQTRLHLLEGHAGEALDDIRIALDDGIPANDTNGQPQLLAARAPECGYAWAIPVGLQLRAEALLLQAAREVISVGWAPPTENGTLNPINVEAVGNAHPTIGKLIDQAKQLLQEALDVWQPLHDPEPERDDQNFKLDGKEYNYRAAETFQVVTDLAKGILTRYPLIPTPLALTDAAKGVPLEPSKPTVSHIVELVAVLVEALPKQVPFVDLASVASLPGFPTGVSEGRYPEEIHDLDDALRRLDPKGPNLVYGKAPHLAKREVRLSGWPDDVRTSLIWLGNLIDEVLLHIAATPPQPLERELLEAFNEAAEFLTSASSTQEDDDDVESTNTQRPPRAARAKEQQMSFDVFLSHNSKDKPDVERLGEALKKRGMTVWLDEWELRPGLSWQDALEEIVTNCKSAAVCVGDDGIGPWQDPEMKALLRRFVNEKKTGNIVPIIPVLLPGAPDDVKLPPFLEEFTWVDLRDGLKKDGLGRLEWGITGVKPNP